MSDNNSTPNFSFPQGLLEAREQGRLIPFIGAGVSMAVQGPNGRLFPNWKELLLAAATKLEAESLKNEATLVRANLGITPPNYLEAAGFARKFLKSHWAAFLQEELDPDFESVKSDSLELARSIWNLGSNFIITTNYDRVLEWACPRPKNIRTLDIESPTQFNEVLKNAVKHPTVWHLHGHIGEPTRIVLTPESYKELYPEKDNSTTNYDAALHTLRSLVSSHTFLFIGFSLDDEHVVSEIKRIAEIFSGTGSTHYVLARTAEIALMRNTIGQLPIQAIEFSDFGEPLLALLRALGGKITPPSSGGSTPTPSSGKTPFQEQTSPDGPLGLDADLKLNQASEALLTWPQLLPGNHWLERPEMNRIITTLKTKTNSQTVLLGPPGSGKSALLSRLASKLKEATRTFILAIKADMVPVEVDSLIKLQASLNLPMEPATYLERLRYSHRIVLIIDQLDALSDLIDLKTKRLDVLLSLIKALTGKDNIHILISCREFDYHHDTRLRMLAADEIVFQLPSWTEIEPLLQQRGFATTGWPQSFREILRTPQHLKIFLAQSRDSGAFESFDSYQAMLEALWQRNVLNDNGLPGRAQLAADLASTMADQETLWLSAARYDKQRSELMQLVSADILRLDNSGRSISFSHQTLFDFARARAFAAGSGHLSEYVLARQDALFVRPKLWSSLVYLRGAEPATYRSEFSKLWNEPSLRAHIRSLLVEFLGQLHTPNEQEAAWLLPLLSTPSERSKTLRAMQGSRGWFERLSRLHLPALMAEEPELASGVLFIIRHAWIFDRERILRLIEEYWIPYQEKSHLAWRAFESLTIWDERAVSNAVKLIKTAGITLFAANRLTSIIAATSPEMAPKLVRAFLEQAVDKKHLEEVTLSTEAESKAGSTETREDSIRASLEQAFDDSQSENITPIEESRIQHQIDRHESYSKIISDSDWYGIRDIAAASPKSFLLEVWPWLAKFIETLTDKHPSLTNRYNKSSLIAFESDLGDDFEDDFLSAIADSIASLARNEPQYFINFIGDWMNTECLEIHLFLSRGLIELADTHPVEVLNYLLKDPRRFALGNSQNEHRTTQELIGRIASKLNSNDLIRLENAIINWHYYTSIPKEVTGAKALMWRKWSRQHRLRLMHAMPESQRSNRFNRLVQEEVLALPDYESEDWSVNVGFIRSPMSSEQMLKAKDEDILRLFETLKDEKTVVMEAAREFGKLGTQEPQRALELINKLSPGSQERPIAEFLDQITEIDSSTLSHIIALHQRGFHSDRFHESAARALTKLARHSQGLPDHAIPLLTSWLKITAKNKDTTPQEKEDKKTDKTRPILWPPFIPSSIPQGNYPILEAVYFGLMLRTPPEASRTLDIFVKHLEQDNEPATWKYICRSLLAPILARVEQQRAVVFLERLFQKIPDVFYSKETVVFIAKSWRWLPVEKLRYWLLNFKNSHWPAGKQAFGELLGLLLASPDKHWTQSQIQVLISDPSIHNESELSSMRMGLAHAAVYELWNQPHLRGIAANTLIQLMPVANFELAKIITKAFRISDTQPNDKHLHSMLRAIKEHPTVLLACDFRFTENLCDLVDAHPDMVLDLSNSLIERWKNASDAERRFAQLNTAHLVDIAITLQRLEPTRVAGLSLFEKLLDLSIDEAQAALFELDARPHQWTVPTPRRVSRQKRPS
ncbi:hypothetical protein D187_003911 [Cystobacter fuscus DSM 2262]|uniref:AAA+ ATPase domain-containing protein n=1 Tax=Cystobacter fuscus (strain ATCC 25194 / DSM 2262 / NBRC 100088 / M29) TaxID=1242864 RepID=S9QAS8_CYSF2|nr:SIR2 family protein [Cystobacter fuscus]EPX58439.1 hypothetical protein D187_003911 [Cystobacter fuscus DSM 2262]